MSMSNNTMKVKVIFGNDIRRWRYSPSESKLSSLNEFVASSFKLQEFWLQYEDDEGDRLTLSSETDFEDAITCAQQEDRKSLKIYVIQGSIHSIHQQKSSHSQLPSTAPQSHSDTEEMNNDTPCLETKAAAIDFLSNPEIVKLLPDLHRRIFEDIKRSKLESENVQDIKEDDITWDSPTNIENIIRNILNTESKFKPIISHVLYERKLNDMIPFLAIKISKHLPFLMNFSCEAIAAWIPHLANVLAHGFNTFEMPGNACSMSSFFPLMCSFMSQHGDYSGLGGFCEQRDSNGDVIHYGVQCNICGTSPIKGARFKCLKCSNFDLCGQCESFNKHDPNHPMIKFKHSSRNVGHGPFEGLHEIMRHFGPPPHVNHPGHPMNHHFNHNWKRRGQFFGQRHRNQQYDRTMDPGQNWWNQGDWNHHRGRHQWKKWNRYNQQQQQQQHHQQWNNQNPWEMHNYYRQQQQPQQQADAASVISSTISNNSVNMKDNKGQMEQKKIKVMADFVKDVTLPDRTYYPTDTVLTKTWKMRNNGDYEWGNQVELVFFKGNESLTLEQRYPVINAKPGQEVEVSAVIKTPDKSGRYCSYYRLQRNGEYFGPRVWVDIFAVDEANTDEMNKNVQNQKKSKKNKGRNKSPKDKQQDKIIKLEKKEAKLEAKQLKLQSKQDKLANKLKDVNHAMDAQNDGDDSQRLKVKQEKLMKAQYKMQNKVDKIQNIKHKVQQRKNQHIQPKLEQPVVIDEQQLLDDIANAAVQDIEQKMNYKQDVPVQAISCVCGASLHKTSAIHAYPNNARINCDICGKFCSSNSTVYHCPNHKHILHPEGYDLCGSCAEYQMQGLQQYMAPPQPPQQAPPSAPPMNIPMHPMQPIQPIQVMNQQPIIPHAQQPAMNIAPDMVQQPQQQQHQQQFVYAVQLEQLRAMGFNDDDKLKAELIQQQGNVQRVANRLLQQQ